MIVKRTKRYGDRDLVHHAAPQETSQVFQITEQRPAQILELLYTRPLVVGKADDAIAQLGFGFNRPRKLNRPLIGADDEHIAKILSAHAQTAQVGSNRDPAGDSHECAESPKEHQKSRSEEH